jgi:SAM-dependent methyltransferase
MNRLRGMTVSEAAELGAGEKHFRAYVGPPKQWDFMGATQFRLLTTLGLRENHKLLDLGCGSLRAGRFLMMDLARGHYFGIEPNDWLIEDAITHDFGADLVALRKPRFLHNDQFDAAEFDERFDHIVAQSIFSHAGPEMVGQAMQNCAAVLARQGLILATIIRSDDAPDLTVEAPGCTSYAPERVLELAAAAGLSGSALPWFHPRRTWYAFAANATDLPAEPLGRHLTGAVLRSAELRGN